MGTAAHVFGVPLVAHVTTLTHSLLTMYKRVERKERRKGYGAGNAFYVRVLRHLAALPSGAKSDQYQLLCANHNMIKRFDGGEALGRKQHKKPWSRL